mmetsp:Transcript_110144/g.322273  ORF Transcript_110144/g.322273 Transcript_110144/m.322273 type:complete len:869 (+) Transcript_110144:53-2659(+)
MTGGPIAEALRHALASLDVDEDTFENLVEMVTDANTENSGGDARQFGKCLEELLEPFLLAFGADPSSVELTCLQVAVAVRGLPEVENDVAAAPPKDVAAANAGPTQKASAPKEAEAKKPAEPGMSLAAFCSAGAGRKASGGYPRTGDGSQGGDKAKPKTLGALMATQVDTADGWGIASPDGLQARADDDSDDDAKAESKQGKLSVREAQKLQKAEKRAQRIQRAEAEANRPPASEDLDDIAAYGLRETREPTEDGGRVNRGVHVEGPGSRNIHLEDISVVIAGEKGSVDLLKETDLHLTAGHVYGLIGKNGSGKTTFLRRLAARALPGLPKHLRFGYVAQELAALQGEQTALEAVVNSDEERWNLLKERQELEAALAGAAALKDAKSLAEADAKAQRFTEIEERLEAIDADGAEDRARQALSMLYFSEKMITQPVANMSGGWKMRLALVRALFSRPDVLLLDEPTNHLDLHGVLWLQQHLNNEWGADAKKKDRIVMVVSHDRSFLDACVTDILEIHECKLRNFTGNYSDYLERVADEQRCLLLKKAEAERQEKQVMKDLKSMKKDARAHKDDKKVRQLKSREKKVEKELQLSSAREFGSDKGDIVTKLREDVTLRFRFHEVDVFWDEDTNFLEVDQASVRQGGTPILRKVTLTLQPWSRIAIVGANGSGKSTLMKALCGELQIEEGPKGRGRKHPQYKPGFVSQNHLESLAGCLHKNCIEYLRDQLPDGSNLRGAADTLTKQSDDSVLRAHLGSFGMGKDALKKVGYLSGGQKARLSLCAATWWGPNTLLLDEPTNHLDVDSLDALSLGLQSFEGAVIVVSHNQGFLRALCDELWIVQDGSVKACPKGEEAFDEFFAKYVKQVKAALK